MTHPQLIQLIRHRGYTAPISSALASGGTDNNPKLSVMVEQYDRYREQAILIISLLVSLGGRQVGRNEVIL